MLQQLSFRRKMISGKFALMRNCKECDSILRGRSDKKFCGDACRGAYNNRQYRIKHAIFRRINRILLNNRRILRMFYQQDHKIVTKYGLEEYGFKFHFQTHHRSAGGGQAIRFCYDYGYLTTDEGKLVIVFNSDDS